VLHSSFSKLRRSVFRGVLLVLSWSCLGCDESAPVIGDACSDLSDCAAARQLVCQAGECDRVRCTRTVQCPIEAACVGGFCDVPRCADDSDCTQGEACFEGSCRSDLCATNQDCGPDEICRANAPRTCVPPPSICASDDDCPLRRRCSLPAGECVPPCEFDTDCAAGRHCDFDGLCRRDCTSSSNCPGETVCARGRCLESDCVAGGCEATRPFRDPEDCQCVECLVDSDCVREGEGCLDSGACVFCPRRASRPECEAAGLVFNAGCCSDCIDDVDCPLGLQCERGRCVVGDPRECGDEDCATGEVCDNGVCRLAGSLRPCTRQSDCPDGEACFGDQTCRVESDRCSGCVEPSRCVAEIGDTRGACVGCPRACETEGCADGEVCVIPDGAAEGFCAESLFSGCP